MLGVAASWGRDSMWGGEGQPRRCGSCVKEMSFGVPAGTGVNLFISHVFEDVGRKFTLSSVNEGLSSGRFLGSAPLNG